MVVTFTNNHYAFYLAVPCFHHTTRAERIFRLPFAIFLLPPPAFPLFCYSSSSLPLPQLSVPAHGSCPTCSALERSPRLLLQSLSSLPRKLREPPGLSDRHSTTTYRWICTGLCQDHRQVLPPQTHGLPSFCAVCFGHVCLTSSRPAHKIQSAASLACKTVVHQERRRAQRQLANAPTKSACLTGSGTFPSPVHASASLTHVCSERRWPGETKIGLRAEREGEERRACL